MGPLSIYIQVVNSLQRSKGIELVAIQAIFPKGITTVAKSIPSVVPTIGGVDIGNIDSYIPGIGVQLSPLPLLMVQLLQYKLAYPALLQGTLFVALAGPAVNTSPTNAVNVAKIPTTTL